MSVESGAKKWIDGACALTDNDGDVIFSTFDTRDLDKSQPKMDCGTHIVTGGTGKYKGIRERAVCLHHKTCTGRRAGGLFRDRHPAQHDVEDQRIRTPLSFSGCRCRATAPTPATLNGAWPTNRASL